MRTTTLTTLLLTSLALPIGGIHSLEGGLPLSIASHRKAGTTVVQNSQTRDVDGIFAPWDTTASPGCALGVIREGKLVHKRGYGMASLDLGVALGPTAVLRIGSTSKQFTAAAITLLAEEGKLTLDDEIQKHIPEIPDYGTAVTVRHLLHHTSGLRDYLVLMFLAGNRPDDFYTNDEVLTMLARQRELNFPPGEEYLYSNSGYFLLGEIVRRISGSSLREYADEMIFQPLGMTHTHFHDDHTEIVPNRASGYSPTKAGNFAIDMTTLDMVGDGGVFTTVEDLLQWDRNFYEQRIGGPEFNTTLLTRGVLNSGKTLDYALGLQHGSYRGRPVVEHSGSFVGFRAQLMRFPADQLSIICLCNLSTANPTALARLVADVYLGIEPETISAAGGGSDNSKTPIVELTEEALHTLTGVYLNDELDAQPRGLRVISDTGHLLLTLSGDEYVATPVSGNRFHSSSSGLDVELEFEPKESPQLTIRISGDVYARFSRSDLALPTTAQLAEYAGTYHSAELGADYRFVLQDGDLYLRHNAAPDSPLLPLQRDQFTVGRLDIEFLRDGQGVVRALSLDAGRVQNLRFERG